MQMTEEQIHKRRENCQEAGLELDGYEKDIEIRGKKLERNTRKQEMGE